MAETKVTLPNGTQITVSGTPDEVASVISKLTSLASSATGSTAPTSPPARGARSRSKAGTNKSGTGITGRIVTLRNEGFFNEPRSLREVQLALTEKGHIYPRTTVSPTVLGLVRRSELRRMKSNKGKWAYVRP